MSYPGNIRAYLDWEGPYHSICREERNFAALLYHTLLINNNVSRFLERFPGVLPVDESQFAIYFEYALLRDLWHTISKKATDAQEANEVKRSLILDSLQLGDSEWLREVSIVKFNSFFGATPSPSIDFIQSPGRWSIPKFAESISNDEEFRRVCKFKWAFNAKPDMVIHTSHDRALCIEAKVESRVGAYPASTSEKQEFKKRELDPVNQIELQRYLMTELLGIETHFVFLSQTSSGHTHADSAFSWHEAFEGLDLSGMPDFALSWIKDL